MSRRSTTITDLAKRLGVSASTVSRALRHDPQISQETTRRVWEAARQTGYRPNPFAVGLVKRNSGTIGLLISEIDHIFFATVIDGILSAAEQAGYQVITCLSHARYSEEKTQIDRLLASHVDGILVCYSSQTEDFSHLQRVLDEEVPLVFFDRNTEDLDAPSVISDDFQGAELAVEHLIARGRRRVMHIKGPEALSISFYRFMGYRETLARHDIPLNPEWIFDSVDTKASEIKEADRLRKALGEVDAVFAFNDYAAYQVLQLLRALGRRVPDDVAIVGFGDLPMAEYLTPTLTSVRQPAFGMGERAVEVLVQQMNRPKEEDDWEQAAPPSLISLPNSLVIRGSS
ncbi:MAG: LacI family transcriptional regulator [Bacteroidetes bacterium]|nr:MAG: LacI family transcriptional regulator [Bacteroidota bacterium]